MFDVKIKIDFEKTAYGNSHEAVVNNMTYFMFSVILFIQLREKCGPHEEGKYNLYKSNKVSE